MFGSLFIVQMRSPGVMWSPDSPGFNAMKTRVKPGNPEARYLKLISRYLQMTASGNPH
jgi:hypothetical protein